MTLSCNKTSIILHNAPLMAFFAIDAPSRCDKVRWKLVDTKSFKLLRYYIIQFTRKITMHPFTQNLLCKRKINFKSFCSLK